LSAVARTADPVLKQKLLDQVVSYLSEYGIGMLSLRPMAAALGMSTNRLFHHFGTKDELITAALERAIEQQAEVEATWLAEDPTMDNTEVLRAWFRWMCQAPANLALVRLGLEAAALDATTTGIAFEVREQQIGLWRNRIEQRLVGEGIPAGIAAMEASIIKATFTGLTLDLMASGDGQRLTKALDIALQRSATQLAGSATESVAPLPVRAVTT
jgi:AcrR family transcriptional regulator